METYEILIMLGVGLAACLFGYRIKKAAFFIIWFILGYFAMQYFLPQINNLVPAIAESKIYQGLLPIAGGLLASLLGFSIEKLCVGGICFCLTMVISIHYFGADPSTLAISGIIGVVLAGFAVMMMKPAAIVATAMAGSYALTLAIFALLPDLSQEQLFFPILAGLGLISTIFQFATTKHVD